MFSFHYEFKEKHINELLPFDWYFEKIFWHILLGDSYNRGEKIDGSRFGADPGLPAEVSSVELTPNGDNHTRAYRCKKCRRVVALQENVVEHVPGEGETAFEWHKRSFSNCFNKSDESECSSIFVEPLRWMTTGNIWYLLIFLFPEFLMC